MTYREAKREYWTKTLAEAGGRVEVAARIARVNRTHVYKAVKTLNVPHQFRRYRTFIPGLDS